MSEEDKFFGVRTKIGGEQEQEEVVSAEAVEGEDDSSELGDEELQGYSKRVQKRINKLRYETHEERRKAENAEKMRDEAYRVAQQIAEKNKEYESLIGRGEEALINQVKERAALSLNQAKEQYRKAYEEGDTDNVVSAQEALTKATAELTEADRYAQNFSGQQQQQQQQQQQWQQQQQQQQQQYQQQQQQQAVPRPDPETEEWAAANPWFMEDGYEEMTSLAYGKHASLVKQGVKPNSPEYFRQIDETVQRAFPDYDWQVGNSQQERTSTASQPSMVVAPTTRNNGAKPRTVKLSPTQRSLAKKLGLTEQQYAKYV
jgi:myosin heavy subunit